MKTDIVYRLESKLGSKLSKEGILITASKYVYKLSCGKQKYILKGYKLPLVPLNQTEAKQIFEEALSTLSSVFQEFYVAKIANAMSQNFVRPIDIKTTVLLPEEASIAIEILLEYGGESLKNNSPLFKLPQDLAYNWMRQTASALALLNGIGVSHLDIKPENMVLDKETGIIKIIDMGSSSASESLTSMYSPTKTLSTKVREFTVIFSPPEVLQAYSLESPKSFDSYIVGSIDPYCWAMCFYSLILNKNAIQLQSEMVKYKMGSISTYMQFMENMERDIDKLIQSKNSKENDLKIFIKSILEKALQFDPAKRPKMIDILESMKNFERKNDISVEYSNKEKENQKSLISKFGIDISQYENMINSLKQQLDKSQKQVDTLKNEQAKIAEKNQKQVAFLKNEQTKIAEENKKIIENKNGIISSLTKQAENEKILNEKIQKEKDLQIQNSVKDLENLKNCLGNEIFILSTKNKELEKLLKKEKQEKNDEIINLKRIIATKEKLYKVADDKIITFQKQIKALQEENASLKKKEEKYNSILSKSKCVNNYLQEDEVVRIMFPDFFPDEALFFTCKSSIGKFDPDAALEYIESRVVVSDIMEDIDEETQTIFKIRGVVLGCNAALQLFRLNTMEVKGMKLVVKIIRMTLEEFHDYLHKDFNEEYEDSYKSSENDEESNNLESRSDNGNIENDNEEDEKYEDSYKSSENDEESNNLESRSDNGNIENDNEEDENSEDYEARIESPLVGF